MISTGQEEEAMKKSTGVTIAMLVTLVPMLFASGCATNSKRAGMDWYSEVPKAEHELHFPHGHESASKKMNCVYDEKRQVYLCQFE